MEYLSLIAYKYNVRYLYTTYAFVHTCHVFLLLLCFATMPLLLLLLAAAVRYRVPDGKKQMLLWLIASDSSLYFPSPFNLDIFLLLCPLAVLSHLQPGFM